LVNVGQNLDLPHLVSFSPFPRDSFIDWHFYISNNFEPETFSIVEKPFKEIRH
jgi:hypothetical protein